MASTDPNYGRILDNRYELLEIIGEGAMGHVYRARHILLGGEVAVKFLSKAQLTEKMRDSFYQEAKVSAQLGYKTIHVVRVSDFGIDEQGILFYVMELLEGLTLSEILQSYPLELPRFLDITQQICLGLKCAHEGIQIGDQQRAIIHRDIKPGNIMTVPSESLGEIVKILDFGISRILETDSHSTNTFMGTFAYASPEQLDGFAIDNRSDLYSLGVMMFRMLTGTLPLKPEQSTFGLWYQAHRTQKPHSFAEVVPDLTLPKSLETLILSCLEKKPENRPRSASVILKELKAIGASHVSPIPTSQVPTLCSKPQAVTNAELTQYPTVINQILWSQTWPQNKPVARIVFPKILVRDQKPLATLWVMLHQREITCLQRERATGHIYRNFLYRSQPHPAALWLTAIYNPCCHTDHEPRWLSAYLDFCSPQVLKILQVLSQQQRYRVLMFALEAPEVCANVITVDIDQRQRHLLEQWIKERPTPATSEGLQVSKDELRQEFELLKPKVAATLRAEAL